MSALTDLKARITGPDGHLLDRGTIAAEMERAIAEENTRYAQGGMVHGVISVLEGAPPFGPYPSVVIEPTVDDRLRQLSEWAEGEAGKFGKAFPSLREPYLEAAKKARSMIDEGPEIDVNINVLASTFRQLTEKQEVRP